MLDSIDMFSGIIAVNSTTLMTLASLFISVFNSMPESTYIKVMDVWMIVTFMYPFVIIFIHTLIHILNKNDKFEDSKGMAGLWFTSRKILPVLFIFFLVTYWIIGLEKWYANY